MGLPMVPLPNEAVFNKKAKQLLQRLLDACVHADSDPSRVDDIARSVNTLIDAFPTEASESQMGRFVDCLQKSLVSKEWHNSAHQAGAISNIVYLLSRLGENASLELMIESYERSNNSSPNTHSYVLKALLQGPNPQEYTDQIVKAASAICDCWWSIETCNERVETLRYSMMLFAQSLMMLIGKWNRGSLPGFPETILKDRARLVLFEILVEVLKTQKSDGSWGSESFEESTAYAFITLASLAPFPLSGQLKSQLDVAIQRGRDFLLQRFTYPAEPETFRNQRYPAAGLSAEASSIAALKIPIAQQMTGNGVADLCVFEEPSLKRIQRMSTLPFFSAMPDWLIRACIVTGYLYFPLFDARRKAIFPRRDIKQNRQWHVLPFAIVASSQWRGGSFSSDMKLEFMVFASMLYEVDHYMEAMIGGFDGVELDDVRQIVHQIFDHEVTDLRIPNNQQPKAQPTNPSSSSISLRAQNLADVHFTLHRVTSYALSHPSVLVASRHDRALLRHELRTYYLAQITSAAESASLSSFSGGKPPQQPFHSWVHTTSAQHIGCLVTFAFLACLNSPSAQKDTFSTPLAKYLAQDLSLHAAALCRMENDIGSVARDRAEGNLNSVDFGEFDSSATTSSNSSSSSSDDEVAVKSHDLRLLAAYERSAYQTALARLQDLVPGKVHHGLRAYCNVVDLYGEIYAMEDISPRLAR
ncbi:MAG: hypothetical protein LQ351_007546 [Letrouitia transgressa]|nr:MAG: hypothetical protein LQ351_007546 [Letrouitia transgressa]